MPHNKPGIIYKGFLLLETIISIFILALALSSASFLIKTFAELYAKSRGRFLAGNLAAYEMEKVRGADFQNIFSFKTADHPADDWSQKISRAPLASGTGEVLAEDVGSKLKKITVSVFYQSSRTSQSVTLETLVAR